MNDSGPFHSNEHIPDHAEAFAKVLVTAARRIREGQSVQDVVAGMCLVEVVTAVSGRI